MRKTFIRNRFIDLFMVALDQTNHYPSRDVALGILSKNLVLAARLVEKCPKTAMVAVLLPNFSIPLEIIQV